MEFRRVLFRSNRHTHGQETTRYVHYDRFRKRSPAAGRIMARLPGGIRVLGGGFLKGGDRQRAEFPPGWPERLRDLYRRGNRNLVERYELPLREHDRSEEHTSELQSLMRTPYAVFC